MLRSALGTLPQETLGQVLELPLPRYQATKQPRILEFVANHSPLWSRDFPPRELSRFDVSEVSSRSVASCETVDITKLTCWRVRWNMVIRGAAGQSSRMQNGSRTELQSVSGQGHQHDGRGETRGLSQRGKVISSTESTVDHGKERLDKTGEIEPDAKDLAQRFSGQSVIKLGVDWHHDAWWGAVQMGWLHLRPLEIHRLCP